MRVVIVMMMLPLAIISVDVFIFLFNGDLDDKFGSDRAKVKHCINRFDLPTTQRHDQ